MKQRISKAVKALWLKFLFGPSRLAIYVRRWVKAWERYPEKPTYNPLRYSLRCLTYRPDDMDIVEYRYLRKTDNYAIKRYLRGRMEYPSSFMVNNDGKRIPYRRLTPNDYERKRAARELKRREREAKKVECNYVLCENDILTPVLTPVV